MYRQIYRSNHPRADITGLVAEHILIAEEKLGRPLKKGEIVHHKDFNKLNNSPGNLLVPITRKQHQQLPEYQARFIIAKGLWDEFHKFWIEEQIRDLQNATLREAECRVVKAENERERLKGKLYDS